MILVGILSALGLLLLALKAGGKKAIGHDIFVDVLITVTLMVCFYGTFSGMTAAMIGGLTASIVLFLMKKTMTHEKLVVEKHNKVILTKPMNVSIPTVKTKWKTVQPNWRK
jgi:hypothetical protein|tara:strand:- start:208 stop:540 length:333 start_codon:yes stop_codon:yes gene_type:complete